MTTKSVESLVEGFRLANDKNYKIVEAVRELIKNLFSEATEEVKYGGILFTSGVQFCGVFAYKEHVSVEFSKGADIKDKFGHLEGSGKGRRHIKLRSISDIENSKLAHYLPLAQQAAGAT
jgi:hypothetical protein